MERSNFCNIANFMLNPDSSVHTTLEKFNSIENFFLTFIIGLSLLGKLCTGRSLNFVQHFPMDFLFFLFALKRNNGFVSWTDSGFHIRVFPLQNLLLYPDSYFFKTKCSMFPIVKFDGRPNFYEIIINSTVLVIVSQNYSCGVQVRDLM